MEANEVDLISKEFLHLQKDASVSFELAFDQFNVLEISLHRGLPHILAQNGRVLKKSDKLRVFEPYSLQKELKR